MKKTIYLVSVVALAAVIALVLRVSVIKAPHDSSVAAERNSLRGLAHDVAPPSTAIQELAITPVESSPDVHSRTNSHLRPSLTAAARTPGLDSHTPSLERMALAFAKEMGGDPEAASVFYRELAMSSTGSAQLGALNRYRFAVERMCSGPGAKKAYIDVLKAKEPKDDLELVLLAQYKTEVDHRQYYATIAANKQSPFAEYAELQRIHYLRREDDEEKNAHRMRIIQHLENFIAEHPDSSYVPHAKLKIAARLVSMGEKAKASGVYRELLRHNADDIAVCAKCVIALGLMQQHTNERWMKQATDLAMFYGTLGNGYYLRKDFDPARVDIKPGIVLESLQAP